MKQPFLQVKLRFCLVNLGCLLRNCLVCLRIFGGGGRDERIRCSWKFEVKDSCGNKEGQEE